MQIGLSHVSVDHIRHHVSEDLKKYISIQEFNGNECHSARIDAAIDYLVKELKFKHSEIKIEGTKLAPSDKAHILWIECDENFIRSIRYKAGLVRNKKINLITFIPSILWRRKQKLIENCKEAQKQDINL